MAVNGIPVVTVEALAARVADGAMVAVPPDYSFVAMAATRALIKRGARDLHLLADRCRLRFRGRDGGGQPGRTRLGATFHCGA